MDSITIDGNGPFTPVTWEGGTGVIVIEGDFGAGKCVPLYRIPTGSTTETDYVPFIDGSQTPYMTSLGALGFLFQLPENAQISAMVRNAESTPDATMHIYSMTEGAPPQVA